MFGAPPNCRPECVIHQDCPSNRACIRNRCEDPCVGSCGFNAICSTQNHKPVCSCLDGYEGDPYAGCNMRQSEYLASSFNLSLVCPLTSYIYNYNSLLDFILRMNILACIFYSRNLQSYFSYFISCTLYIQ